jgi:methylenetetrahydrofolate dehydrogenase (NADP+)/methenyltetrahydrofolate cyclohydrolase
VVLDGKKIAEDIFVALGDSLRGATLGIVMSEGSAAALSFVRAKERAAERLGVKVVRGGFAELLSCDAVVIQLPHLQSAELLPQLPPEKDVDALGSAPLVASPVAGAIAEMLRYAGIDPKGTYAVVVGEGRLVGLPAAAMMRALGAEVEVISLERGSLESLKDADIVIAGAGSPGLIVPDMLKQGVVLIDAGTSESQGKVAGDCDPSCAGVASVFAPVPGGLGPVAVAMLFKNLADLRAQQRG